MEPTIGMNFRMSKEIFDALERVAPVREKNKFVLRLLRKDLERRGELKPDPATALQLRLGSKSKR